MFSFTILLVYWILYSIYSLKLVNLNLDSSLPFQGILMSASQLFCISRKLAHVSGVCVWCVCTCEFSQHIYIHIVFIFLLWLREIVFIIATLTRFFAVSFKSVSQPITNSISYSFGVSVWPDLTFVTKLLQLVLGVFGADIISPFSLFLPEQITVKTYSRKEVEGDRKTNSDAQLSK